MPRREKDCESGGIPSDEQRPHLKQDSLYRHVQMAQMEDNLDNMRKNVLLVRDRKNKLEVRSAIDRKSVV